MRILHILDHSLPLHSGYSFRTAAILRNQRQLGWSTIQLTSPKQGPTSCPKETVDDLEFYRTPWESKSLPLVDEVTAMFRLYKRLCSLIPMTNPDIIHAHSPVLTAIPALRAGKNFGIPVVYEVRAFWEDAAVDHGTTKENSLRYRVTRAAETYVLRRTSHIFTICEGLKRDIAERGISEDHITVIPNSVDMKSFPILARSRSVSPLSDKSGNKITLGFIGSFYEYEGLDILISSYARLLSKYPNLRLLFVGGGPAEPRLHKQVAELGLQQVVSFAGRIPHSEVSDYYSKIDIMVYPRRSMRLTELVTPLKPLEAMAHNRLVLASDVGGHKELIRNGKTGILFTADDVMSLVHTLDKTLLNIESHHAICHAARDFVVNSRNWIRSVEKYRDAYNKTLQPKNAE